MAHYPLDGNANDATFNARHGNLNDLTLVNDRHGLSGALYFDGTKPGISVPDSLHPQGVNPTLTYSVWVKASRQNRFQVFVGGGRTNNNLRSDFGFVDDAKMFYAGEGNDFKFQHELPEDEWAHLAMTKQGRTLDLYVDGELVTTGSHPRDNRVEVQEFHIGWNGNAGHGGGQLLKGTLDDVRIYNRALSDLEVKQLFLGIEFEIQEETSAPRITGFAPQSGSPGTRVVLTGENLVGVEEVRFGSLEATFTVVSATSIESYVPKGAVTGIITVKGSNGTARSALPFEVGQGSDSSLRLEIERTPNPEQLNLVILGDADTKVVIQYSDDLMFWEAIGGEIPLQEGKFTLSILADGNQLFYRVLKLGE